jgi:replication initiation and membrane attachment protein DnaB
MAKIDVNKAVDLLYKKVGNTDYSNLIYEVTNDLIHKYVKEIEDSADDIVNEDGESLVTDEFGERWYDEDFDALREHITDDIYRAVSEM